MLKIIFILFISLFNTSSPAFAEDPYVLRLTYEQCIESALKNNDQLRAAEKDVDLARGRVLEAHPPPIPVIKYEHRIAPVPEDVDNGAESFLDGDISVFNNFKVELGAPLATFGKIKMAQELADIGLKASKEKKYKSTDEIAFKIYQSYQGILLARELTSLAEQAEKAIADKIKGTEKEKTVDQIQILKMKVALYEVQRKLEEVRKKKKLALFALKLQLGLEDETNFDVASSHLLPVNFKLESIDNYVNKARLYLHEFKLLDVSLLAKEKQLRLEKLKPIPDIGVGGFFDIGRAPNIRGAEDESNFSNPFNFTKGGVGFQLKGELDYGKTRAKVAQAKADVLKAVYEKRAAYRGLELDVRKSYYDVVEAKNLFEKASEEKKAARQLVFLTKSNLDIGIGDKKDYYDALQSYLLFQGRELESIFNYNVAIAELKKKIGQLYPQQRKASE